MHFGKFLMSKINIIATTIDSANIPIIIPPFREKPNPRSLIPEILALLALKSRSPLFINIAPKINVVTMSANSVTIQHISLQERY